jgi:hypothetical protein
MANGTWKPPENTMTMDADQATEHGDDNEKVDDMDMDDSMNGGVVAKGRSEEIPSTAEEGPFNPASVTTPK